MAQHFNCLNFENISGYYHSIDTVLNECYESNIYFLCIIRGFLNNFITYDIPGPVNLA